MSSLLWRCLQWPGHEFVRLDGRNVSGHAVFAMKGDVCSLQYEIACNDAWETRRVSVQGWVGDRSIEVDIDAADIAPCLDIDLNFSPSTNTLPIRRLNLRIGESARVTAAWLVFPSFLLEHLDQTYTRLSQNVYRYDNVESGFSAELRVNEEGLVLEYGDLWRAE
jgi:hypothetical protein